MKNYSQGIAPGSMGRVLGCSDEFTPMCRGKDSQREAKALDDVGVAEDIKHGLIPALPGSRPHYER